MERRGTRPTLSLSGLTDADQQIHHTVAQEVFPPAARCSQCPLSARFSSDSTATTSVSTGAVKVCRPCDIHKSLFAGATWRASRPRIPLNRVVELTCIEPRNGCYVTMSRLITSCPWRDSTPLLSRLHIARSSPTHALRLRNAADCSAGAYEWFSRLPAPRIKNGPASCEAVFDSCTEARCSRT
jgi:hypothetical protein